MKYKEISRMFNFKNLSKLIILSTTGFCLFYLVFSIVMISVGTEFPLTFNGEKIRGAKAIFADILFIPFYFIAIVMLQFFILGMGLWVSRLFFKKN